MEKLAIPLLVVALAIGWLAGGDASTPVNGGHPAEPSKAIAPSKTVTIGRSGDSHFYTDAIVNGVSIRFVVDTGASTVALTKEDAKALGFNPQDHDYTERGQTANGAVATMPVKLETISIGGLKANSVDADIIRGDLHISLLGQSFLEQVGSVTIEGDKMVLR